MAAEELLDRGAREEKRSKAMREETTRKGDDEDPSSYHAPRTGSEGHRETAVEGRFRDEVPQDFPEAIFSTADLPSSGAVNLAAPVSSAPSLSCGNLADGCMDALSNDLRSDGDGKKGSEVMSELRKCQGHHIGVAFPLILSLLDSYVAKNRFKSHGKTKPTGDGFPLPTSMKELGSAVSLNESGLVILRCLAVGLNSCAGFGVNDGGKVSKLQAKFLQELALDVDDMMSWSEIFEEISWDKFFRFRGVDYQGDEVTTAQHTSWNHLSPAIPSEVATVDLLQVVEGGLKHYVACFEEYLLDESLRKYTKPPRVMVPDGSWEQVCRGLLESGICTLLPEREVFHVEGKPLLNGLFGVSKGEMANGYDVHRLIMNLVPLNNICRGVQGDVATLPSWSSTSPLNLLPSEELVVSSEDVRCFFYIFRVPDSWWPYLGFNKAVPPNLHPGREGKHYLCSRVLPMGFKNSVSIAQAVHRTVVRRASQRPEAGLQPQAEMRKDKVFPSVPVMHRIYLDNFDLLEKVDRSMSELVAGTAGPSVLALRAEYDCLGIPRHPKKSVMRQHKAEVQGAIIDGQRGCAYPKPQKLMKYIQLTLLLLGSSHCSQRQLQVVAGGLVYVATFRRPLMGSLNAIWGFIEEFNKYPAVIRLEIPNVVKLELVRFLAMTPLARMSFRTEPSPWVTASDASTTGGGVTVSHSLTNFGQVAASCTIRGDVPEPEDVGQVLTIGLFDGVGALRVAADALGLPVIGHVSVENNPQASRVLESKFPGTVFFEDVAMVDLQTVKSWACQFTNASVVIIGAGPPCQGVSGLNSDRRGALRDHRSCLYVHVSRIESLVRTAFPWAQVHRLAESVQSMDLQDREVMSTSFGQLPWAIDASGLSMARRPRLYWVSWELTPGQGVDMAPPSSSSWSACGTIRLEGQVDQQDYLTAGWTRCSEEPLPTFTTSRPREHPGRRPAGLYLLTPQEREAWEEDRHRFPPYRYQWQHYVQNGDQYRLVNMEERETILGFPRGYTKQCVAKGLQGTQAHEDLRLTLLGNTWNVTVITWLLAQLCHPLGLCSQASPQQCIDLTKPGSSTNLASFLARPPMARSSKPRQGSNALVLVRKLMSMVSIKGEDILLSSHTEDNLRHHRLRASIPARIWAWRTVCSWLWRGSKERINVLEMRAVLCALRWRIIKCTLPGASTEEMAPKMRVHVEGRSKQDRQAIRKNLGPLRQLTVQPRTRARYDKALSRFFAYLKERNTQLPKQKHLLDGVVSDYLECLWSSGEGRSLASDTLASLQDKDPSIKGLLGGSWRLLKTWVAHEIPNRAPPLTEVALHTLVGHALFREQPVFALSLLLGFYGLLRTGELLNIRNKDVSQSSATSVAVISLGLTKAGQRAGAAESITISEQETLRRLWQWKCRTSPNTSLCPAPHVRRKLFNDTISALELEESAQKPTDAVANATDAHIRRQDLCNLLRRSAAGVGGVLVGEGR
eukprot:Skav214773  [mRNA]  locus=scaffold3923:40117:45759:+ [translate_table: standard]